MDSIFLVYQHAISEQQPNIEYHQKIVWCENNVFIVGIQYQFQLIGMSSIAQFLY